jgi:hypothetical protein
VITCHIHLASALEQSFVHISGTAPTSLKLNDPQALDTISALIGLQSHNELSLQLTKNDETDLFKRTSLSLVVFVNSLAGGKMQCKIMPCV